MCFGSVAPPERDFRLETFILELWVNLGDDGLREVAYRGR